MLQIGKDGVALFAPLPDSSVETSAPHYGRDAFSHRAPVQRLHFFKTTLLPGLLDFIIDNSLPQRGAFHAYFDHGLLLSFTAVQRRAGHSSGR
jgi:hypothetical protein